MKKILTVVALVVVLVVVIWGIRKGGENGRASGRDADGLEKAVRWRVEDIAEGNWGVLYRTSNDMRCWGRSTLDEFEAQSNAAVERASAAGIDISKLRLERVEIKISPDNIGDVTEYRTIDGQPFGEPIRSTWNFSASSAKGGTRGGTWQNIDCGIGL